MAAMYAVYHGPVGLERIARKVHALTQLLKTLVEKSGYAVTNKNFFDTLTISSKKPSLYTPMSYIRSNFSGSRTGK